jgi:hypothetical protein
MGCNLRHFLGHWSSEGFGGCGGLNCDLITKNGCVCCRYYGH